MVVIYVINQDKDGVINYEQFNYKIRDIHIIAYAKKKEVFLGTYKDTNSCKEIIKDMLLSYENGSKSYYMPQKQGDNYGDRNKQNDCGTI